MIVRSRIEDIRTLSSSTLSRGDVLSCPQRDRNRQELGKPVAQWCDRRRPADIKRSSRFERRRVRRFPP